MNCSLMSGVAAVAVFAAAILILAVVYQLFFGD